jgi:hypothetical protein
MPTTATSLTKRRFSIVPAAEKKSWSRRPAIGRPLAATVSTMLLPNQ